jgi:tetratricopeptide (TPR) repeat protein
VALFFPRRLCPTASLFIRRLFVQMTVQKQHFERAKALHLSGNWQQAEAIYLQLLDQNPLDVDSLHLLGLLHADTSRAETGVQILRTAIAIDGPKPWLCRNLGIILERSGDRTGAIACYRQALLEAPADHELWAAAALLLAAEGRAEEAAESWQHAFESATCDPDAAARYRLALANALAVTGDRRAAIFHYNRLLERNPDNVEAVFHRAVAYMQENEPLAAIDGFCRTLDLDPRHARAENNLGVLFQLLKDHPSAIEHYRRAIRLDPSFHAALYNLGCARQEFAQPREAVAVFRKLLQIQPDHAAAWTNLGNAWLGVNQIGLALNCYQKTLELTPAEPAAEWNAGLASLITGDFSNGWRGYERRFDVKGAAARRSLPMPLWTGEALDGKSLLLHAEQGLGDTIQFIRYVPVFAAQGAQVVVECQAALLPFLAQSIPAAHFIAASPEGAAPPLADFHLPLLSAPALAGTAIDTIPFPAGYLRASADAVSRWGRWLGRPRGRQRVGICWAVKPNHKHDRNRSIPSEALSELTEVAGVEWVSLQKGRTPGDVLPMRNAAAELGDFDDTAGLIENLDLVISVDTSVAHLAGALGRPVWILLPYAPDWRWMLDRTDSPWYDSARLFRQAEIGRWRPVLRNVAAAMATAIPPRERAQSAIMGG